jgi:hypothetical protein
VVEPGYFRTDFLDLDLDRRIEEPYRRLRRYCRRGALGCRAYNQQPGDPEKLAQAMVALVKATKPPLRLPLEPTPSTLSRAKTPSFSRNSIPGETCCLRQTSNY